MERYSNKRGMIRKGGRFAKLTAQDVGIGGVCPVCRHFLLRHYDGDPNTSFPDPRAFRYRCFACEPETEEEKARKVQPKQPTLTEFFAPFIERSKS